MTTDYTLIGKRVARFRKKQGLTQEQLAEMINMSTVYISHIENSHSIPSLETVMKLCDVLWVTPDMLLLGTQTSSNDYLTTDISDKIRLCSTSQRQLINGFIDLLLSQKHNPE